MQIDYDKLIDYLDEGNKLEYSLEDSKGNIEQISAFMRNRAILMNRNKTGKHLVFNLKDDENSKFRVTSRERFENTLEDDIDRAKEIEFKDWEIFGG